MTDRPCIVVAGMGRCGTSAMMQMLNAAGIPCIGDWPAFETAASTMDGFNPKSFAALSNVAVKIIDPANLAIGDMQEHVVIWLDRNVEEQAKSQVKFLSFLGAPIGNRRLARRVVAADLRKTRDNHRACLGVPGQCHSITVEFEDLVDDPRLVAGNVATFLNKFGWSADSETMAGQIRKRPSNCLPYMLEAQMLREIA